MTKKTSNPDQYNNKGLYDLAALLRFINTALLNRQSDDPSYLSHQKTQREQLGIPEQAITEDMLAAARALEDALMHGVDLRELVAGKPGIDDRRNLLNHPVANIAMARLNGELTRAQAVEEIMNSEGVQTEKAAIEILSKAMKGKQPTLDTFKTIFKQAGWGEYTAAPQLSNDEKAAAVLIDKSLNAFKRTERIKEIFGYDWEQAKDYIKKHNPS